MIREACIGSFVVLVISPLVLADGATAQVNVWQSVGPDGGTILVFAADPSDPDTIYAAVEPTTIYRSDDAGASWSRLGTVSQDSDATLRALAVDPRTPSTL
jgi:photosystem II stability/assembly factor-like uncharacterized protein